MPIKFAFYKTKTSLSGRLRLKIFLATLFKKNKKKIISLTYIFCSDSFLLDVNRKFLKHDYYTDIITFNLSDFENEIEGEVYISIDRVRENAEKLGVTIREELHRVIFHGALHLCDYKDKTENEKKEMRKEENKYLKAYFR